MELLAECSRLHSLRKIKTKKAAKQVPQTAFKTIKVWAIRGIVGLPDRSLLVIISLRSHPWPCKVQLTLTLILLRIQGHQ